jgi:hypothetical protein
LHKLALSYQSSSPHLMDLHPGESPRRFQVQSDPIYHVYLANAVTLAYSAIEELGLEIRANAKNPSKMPDGTWNPVVRANRATASKVRHRSIGHAYMDLARTQDAHREKAPSAFRWKTKLVPRQCA